jgi:eukaryotic-like serine/threonine-protein kinase
MRLPTQSRFGPYEIRDFIGAGGMGEVYSAHDTRLERSVAIKVLPADFAQDPDQRTRLEREARAAGALNHPNVLTIFDIGIHEGNLYVVTELLEGEPLRDLITQGRISRPSAISYGVQIASGLSAAHEKSIIHRDLKPENIFLTTAGIIKILDFGLAKIESPLSQQPGTNQPTQSLTKPGTLLGTVLYMSPEQARGRVVDARSDLFSFGILLFEMLASRRPFHGETLTDVLTSILRDEPDFGLFSPPLSDELVRILSGCLAKNPDERIANAREIVLSLRMIEAEYLARTGPLERKRSEQKTERISIAVLPFTDLSAEGDQKYFCDGMTDELVTALTKVDGIRVVARTSSLQFQGQPADVRKIGKQLGAQVILNGSIRKAGNRIRITADLLDVQDGSHLWSEKYDRELADLFAIQDEIALTIVETLKRKLGISPEEVSVKRYTDNQEAYNLYLKGRYYWNKRHQDGLERAVEYFHQAIVLDSSYALAYSGLADCYSILGFYAFRPPIEMADRSIEAARTSLRLDPTLPEGHLSLGASLLYFEYDWEAGDREIRRALELNPSFALGHCWYSGFLSLMGRFQQAREHADQARHFDPLSPLFSYFAGFNLYNERRYDEALKQFHNAFEIEPDFLLAKWCAALAYMKKRMHDPSIQLMEEVCAITNRSPFYVSYLGLAYAESGARSEAENLLYDLRERSVQEYVAPISIARVLMGLNRLDESFEEMKKALAQKNTLIYVFHSPEFDQLRSDPRFQQILGPLMP